MNELIKITYENNRPTVSGRVLHEALEVDSNYTTWFSRMTAYGFAEGVDYLPILENRSDGKAGKPRTDHQLTFDMAKELCMIQRTEKGKQCRLYFLEVEKRWNSPEAVMARALQFANNQLEVIRGENKLLQETVSTQEQQIEEMKPKVSYYDLILQSKNAVPVTVIAKDYGMSARAFNEILHEHEIQYKMRDTWILYQQYAGKGYTKSRTYPAGRTSSVIHTCWTQKGRLFLYDKLKERGILPMMEQDAA